jgi:hypothetical protein
MDSIFLFWLRLTRSHLRMNFLSDYAQKAAPKWG